MTMTTTTIMTADELFHIPDDALNRELVAGELVIMSPDNNDHGEIVAAIIELLRAYVRVNNLGRVSTNVGFKLYQNPDTVLAPDVAFVSTDRAPIEPSRRGFIALCPDLAVEVLSPSNTASEINRKLRLYLDTGARQVWIVDPEARTVTIHTPDRIARTLLEGEIVDSGDVVPGFTISVTEAFA